MRIISKQRDYYDSAMAYGQDQTVVFVRNAEELDFKLLPKNIQDTIHVRGMISDKRGRDHTITFYTNVIVFCGKTYRSITCQRKSKIPHSILTEDETKVFYNIEELETYLAQYGFEIKDAQNYWWQKDRITQNVRNFLGAQGTTELMEFCIANRYVVLTYANNLQFGSYEPGAGRKLVANGLLDKFQFYRVFDAFSAYQELDMFVSGTLPQSTAMPITISDKDRIQQHGFDKYSFRKPKEK